MSPAYIAGRYQQCLFWRRISLFANIRCCDDGEGSNWARPYAYVPDTGAAAVARRGGTKWRARGFAWRYSTAGAGQTPALGSTGWYMEDMTPPRDLVTPRCLVVGTRLQSVFAFIIKEFPQPARFSSASFLPIRRYTINFRPNSHHPTF